MQQVNTTLTEMTFTADDLNEIFGIPTDATVQTAAVNSSGGITIIYRYPSC